MKEKPKMSKHDENEIRYMYSVKAMNFRLDQVDFIEQSDGGGYWNVYLKSNLCYQLDISKVVMFRVSENLITVS